MTVGKLITFVFGLLFLVAVAIGITSINHPIILKWVTGSAKHHGRSIPATLYTNGQVNDSLKVFYTDEANSYLMCLTKSDSLKVFNLNLNEGWIGRPEAASKGDYDFIAGHLFQSETGRHFTRFRDVSGSNFDPQFAFISGQLRFNMPPNEVGFDSVRIRFH